MGHKQVELDNGIGGEGFGVTHGVLLKGSTVSGIVLDTSR